ncbi:agmatinase family protein [Streptomyces sp. NPDC048636]|uniref:agmatinase family protein n=1 Tax=Streptomyces sp. NPDC048636 TaxID=3155762 RepID=UPI00341B6DE2
MSRYGALYGPDVTFRGVGPCALDEPGTYEGADVVILGAPLGDGVGHRPGTRSGPATVCSTGRGGPRPPRPSLPLRVDALRDLRVRDAGCVELSGKDTEGDIAAIEEAVTMIARSGAVPFVLGGDHTIALPDITGVARHHGMGRISVMRFGAHAGTGEIAFGHPRGHGPPLRHLLESGAVRGDRVLPMGLRGHSPGPGTPDWIADHGIRGYAMSDVVTYGLDACLDEAMATAVDDCDGVFLSVSLDVVDPGSAPGARTTGQDGLTSRQLLDAVRRLAWELPVVGMDVAEGSPSYDRTDVTAFLGNRIVLEALSGMAARRRGDTWRPARPLLEGHGTIAPRGSPAPQRPDLASPMLTLAASAR